MPPLFFIVVFWGRVHRDYFLNLCLPSLLSQGNIPSVKAKSKSKFLICTTKGDWEKIQREKVFGLLSELIEPKFFPLSLPTGEFNKLLVMSEGHKVASQYAHHHGARGVFLTPDLVLSENSVEQLERISRQGKKVVLCAAVRFELEGCLREFEKKFDIGNGLPLSLHPRYLTDVAIKNMHSETKQFEWKKSYFADYPIACFWKLKKKNCMIIHSFSWAPLLVDYSAIEKHDTSTFENWTLDGDYIFQNFKNTDLIHVVEDSDEIMLVSFTCEKELHHKPNYHLLKFWPFSNWTKIRLLRRIFHSNDMDDLKRSIFSRRIRWKGLNYGYDYSCPESEHDWLAIEKESLELINEAISVKATGSTDYVYLFTAYGTWFAVLQYLKSLLITVPVKIRARRLQVLGKIKNLF